MANKIEYGNKSHIFLPESTALRFEKYCEETKLKDFEQLRRMLVLDSRKLQNTDNLADVYSRTMQRNLEENYKLYGVTLPKEVIDQINRVCRILRIYKSRGYFMYFLIADRLEKTIAEESGKNAVI